MPTRTILLLCALLPALLTGCAGVVVGGAATGAMVAHDRRTTGTMIEDQSIELKAARIFYNDSRINEQAHLQTTSFNRIVLLTGETPTESMRQRAAELVRGIAEVRKVHNEISVAAPAAMMSRTSDSLITAKVKTSLFSSEGLRAMDATRIKVVTDKGTVYLMGLVTRAEADAATEAARQVGGVQRVVRLFEYTG